MISREDVLKISELSKFDLKEREIDIFQVQLNNIMNNVIERLNEVDVTGIAPLYSPLEKTSYFRSDESEDCSIKEEILNSSANYKDGRLTVVQVVS